MNYTFEDKDTLDIYLLTFTCRLSLVAATVTEKKLQSLETLCEEKLAAVQQVPKPKLSCTFYIVRNSRGSALAYRSARSTLLVHASPFRTAGER